jgi:hypothetical protein
MANIVLAHLLGRKEPFTSAVCPVEGSQYFDAVRVERIEIDSLSPGQTPHLG